jgi:anti-sigma factor RsiW
MSHSGIVDRLARLVPLRPVKARLAKHAETCPACSARLAGRDEVRRILVQAADLGRMDDIWPAVRRGVEAGGFDPGPGLKPGRAGAARPRAWRFAAASLGLLAAVFVTAGLIRYLSGPGDLVGSEEGFRLHYARVERRAADTFVVQSPEDGMVLVWVGKAL